MYDARVNLRASSIRAREGSNPKIARLLGPSSVTLNRVHCVSITACWAGRWCLGRTTSESAIACVLPPLGQREGMDLQRRGHRRQQHAGLLTQLDGRQIELVAVRADRTWP
jgi:hypothetical protein